MQISCAFATSVRPEVACALSSWVERESHETLRLTVPRFCFLLGLQAQSAPITIGSPVRSPAKAPHLMVPRSWPGALVRAAASSKGAERCRITAGATLGRFHQDPPAPRREETKAFLSCSFSMRTILTKLQNTDLDDSQRERCGHLTVVACGCHPN